MEAQGERRRSELWCGTAWKVLALMRDMNETYNNIGFCSTAVDGGLLVINKTAMDNFIEDLIDSYGVHISAGIIDDLYPTDTYSEEILTGITNNTEKYRYYSDIGFVSALGLEDYFSE